MALGEFSLIEQIRSKFGVPSGITGIGDDCAVIPQKDGQETLVTTDMLMEGVHFLIEDVDPYDLGWKSAAVNISDIAGMGGRPVGSFLAFALPKSLDDNWKAAFIDGYKALSDKYDCPLLGGDTTSSLDRLCICVTVLGTCAEGTSRKRSYARPGDLVCTTGPLGDSGAGLKLVLARAASGLGKDAPLNDTEKELVRRHYRPEPRVGAGLALSAIPGVHAMMDISDGIGSDLRHILKASGVGAEIDISSLPLSAELAEIAPVHGWDAADLALCGGEDYELLFTASPDADLSSVPHHVIGRITAGPDLVWKGTDKDYMGYRHF